MHVQKRGPVESEGVHGPDGSLVGRLEHVLEDPEVDGSLAVEQVLLF